MNEPIVIIFLDGSELHSITITPEEADWWTSVGEYDIHYCEDYNEICVYKSQGYSTTIHKQVIDHWKPFDV